MSSFADHGSIRRPTLAGLLDWLARVLGAPVVLPRWSSPRDSKPPRDPWAEVDFGTPPPWVQPVPVAFTLLAVPGSPWSVLSRRWAEGDSARCRLCPVGRCVATADVCMIAVKDPIRPADAPLLDLNGRRWGDEV